MDYNEVMNCQNFQKEGVIAIAETMSGDRFIIKKIGFNNKKHDFEVAFTNGVVSKPAALKEIKKFDDIKSAQKYLIGQEV